MGRRSTATRTPLIDRSRYDSGRLAVRGEDHPRVRCRHAEIAEAHSGMSGRQIGIADDPRLGSGRRFDPGGCSGGHQRCDAMRKLVGDRFAGEEEANPERADQRFDDEVGIA